jgi:hypothetical protein
MTLVVHGNGELKEELVAQGTGGGLRIEWISKPADFPAYPDADMYMDLLFEPSKERADILVSLKKPVIISSISGTLKDFPLHFIRINGWNTFLKRATIEACCRDEATMKKAGSIFSLLNRKISWVPDVPGFI